MFRSLVTLSLALGLAACGGKHGSSGSDAPAAGGGTGGGSPSKTEGFNVSTEVAGAPAAGQAVTTDQVELKFNLSGDDLAKAGLTLVGYECKFGETATFVKCEAPFVISGLRNGENYTVTVRAVLRKDATQETVYAKEATSTFKVAAADPGTPVTPGQQIPTTPSAGGLASTLQVGSAYQIEVPAGMHVTEYSTSKTTGVLSFFRILPESDPYYLGNFSCSHEWDRLVASMSPQGEGLTYCHSTPSRDTYKDEQEYRLANNHVEIATDTALVTPEAHERLTFSIFDEDYEFMASRSRFYNVCMNSTKDFITVPMLNNFFIGKNPEQVDFWYCDAYLPDNTGRPSLWRIGSFHDVDHMDWGCPDCKYDRAVEAVYMVRANAGVFTPYAFAKVAQKRILDVMTKVTP